MDEEERKHLLDLRQVYLRRRRVLEKQVAYGPQISSQISMELEDVRHELANIEQRLGSPKTLSQNVTVKTQDSHQTNYKRINFDIKNVMILSLAALTVLIASWFGISSVTTSTLRPTITSLENSLASQATVQAAGRTDSNLPTDVTVVQSAQSSPSNDAKYVLLDHANSANWFTGSGEIPFGGIKDQRAGGGFSNAEAVLEDGASYSNLLFTHPNWHDQGFVRGEFDLPEIKSEQHFLSKVGFASIPLEKKMTNGVVIIISFRGNVIWNGTKQYTGKLEDIDVDMSNFIGQSGKLILEVKADGNYNNDLLNWVYPRIDYS